MLNIENLTYLRNSLLAEYENLQSEILAAPNGRLNCKTRENGKQEFYIYQRSEVPHVPPRQIYVNESLLPMACQIAQSMYAQAKCSRLNKLIKGLNIVIDACINTPAENILLQKHPWLADFLPMVLTNDEKLSQWKLAPYERNLEHPESLRYQTCVPELVVRSKSEADIVSRLEKYGVPYHYDEVVYFNDVRISIDFVCLNVKTGKKWYWDHRGMLDNPSYIDKTIFCERVFLNAGIIQGINLIVTSETSAHPLNMLTIDDEIQRYLL